MSSTPPSEPAHLPALIAEIDRVLEAAQRCVTEESQTEIEAGRREVRESQRRRQEEEVELLRDSERIHRQFVSQKWRWLAQRLLLHSPDEPTVAEILIAAELSAILDE